jgi:UDP-glucuronate 4-epimerase
MKILVTGSAGFIGYHLSKKLLALGHKVIGVDNLNDYYDVNLKKSRLKDLGILSTDGTKHIKKGNFEFLYYDIKDKNLWEDVLINYEFDFVMHLAAQAGVRYSIENPQTYISNNINGFISVLEFCKEKEINLIYASSSSVYGDSDIKPYKETDPCLKPLSIYAMTKRANELAAFTYNHLYNLKSIGLRFFTVYGPYGRPDMAPFIFTNAAFNSTEIKVFNHGNQYRDFTYIDDIINGMILIIESGKVFNCEVYNIGKGSPIHLGYFIELIEKLSGNKIKRKYTDAQSGDTSYTYADLNKMRNDFKYNPSKSIEEGMSEFIKWYQEYNKKQYD